MNVAVEFSDSVKGLDEKDRNELLRRREHAVGFLEKVWVAARWQLFVDGATEEVERKRLDWIIDYLNRIEGGDLELIDHVNDTMPETPEPTEENAQELTDIFTAWAAQEHSRIESSQDTIDK